MCNKNKSKQISLLRIPRRRHLTRTSPGLPPRMPQTKRIPNVTNGSQDDPHRPPDLELEASKNAIPVGTAALSKNLLVIAPPSSASSIYPSVTHSRIQCDRYRLPTYSSNFSRPTNRVYPTTCPGNLAGDCSSTLAPDMKSVFLSLSRSHLFQNTRLFLSHARSQ